LILSFDFDAKTEKKRLTCKKSCQSKSSEFYLRLLCSPAKQPFLGWPQPALTALKRLVACLPGLSVSSHSEEFRKDDDGLKTFP